MKKNIANWGNYPVVASDDQSFSWKEDLPGLLENRTHIIPRGNGRCYGDASLAQNTITCTKLEKVLSFDTTAGILDCEAGLTLDKILEIIVPKGWFLPVTPGTKFITIGGGVASDVHGKNHHVDGAISRHVVDMDIYTAKLGLVTCSRENYPDLFEATCGGMGLTGVITRVKFKLKKIETSYITQKQVKARNLTDVLELFDQYAHYTYSVAWIDCLKKGKAFGRSILILGEHTKLDELKDKRKNDPLALPKKKQLTFPFNLPSWVLNTITVKLFNFLYYNKNTRRELNNIVSYEPFFYPLDAILHWNRGYGKKGFIQYQFVLPMERRDGLERILSEISKRGWGSFLAVLKVFGDQDDLISFPTKGYTLALDFPVRKGLFEFLDEMDKIVLECGGRLYLSKDARMKPETLRQGYDRFDEFVGILRQYDPEQKFRSIQSDRLQITTN